VAQLRVGMLLLQKVKTCKCAIVRINGFARSLLLVIASSLVLSACGSSDNTIYLDEDMLTVPVPKNIRRIAALDNNRLEIQVSVNGNQARTLPVTQTDDVITTTVNTPADQSNEITIAWFAIVDSQRVILADFTDNVAAGTTVMNVTSYNDNGERFDADGDGRSNLSEALDNRKLLSQFDMKVPRTNALESSPIEYITDDGIDSEFSGDAVEVDDDSSFRLRHNGTELTVYLCGNDQTLFGDNSADDGDGRYWHDDTVFIYLDGSDNTVNPDAGYDQVDDFQFAFVRSTGEKFRSKGPDGVCPNADCVVHRFYQSSSECEYELDVVLPLNEFNMALDAPIGFDIEIVDDDNGDLREGSSAWIGFNDRSDQHPATFGTIRLD